MNKKTYHFHVKAMVRDFGAIGNFYERKFSIIVSADSDGAIIHALNNSGFEVSYLTDKVLELDEIKGKVIDFILKDDIDESN